MKRMLGRLSLPLTLLTPARRGLLICALLSLAMLAAGGQATAARPTPVSLIEADNVVASTPTQEFDAGVFKGTVGTVPVSGTTLMEVTVVGQTFHCVHSWVEADGSVLVIHSDCNAITLNGQWRVVYGDGMFAGFFAEGSLVMALNGYVLDGVQYQVAEILSGTVH